MKYIIIVVISYIFLSCSSKDESVVGNIPSQKDKIENDVFVTSPQDLKDIPQNIEYYTKGIIDTNNTDIQNDYESHYFSVWNYKKPIETVENVTWAFRSFNATNSYGENLLPLSESFFEQQKEESNFCNYLSLSKKGLALYHTNLRAMPTQRPVLRDPNIAGEGFPFDYMQNSSINANTPLFVSHYSKNKQWLFVFTSFAYGWIPSNEVVFIQDKHTKTWQDAQQVVLIKENIALFDTHNEALFNSRIGIRLPIIKEDENFYTVLAVSTYGRNSPRYTESKISKNIAIKSHLEFTQENINLIVNELHNSNYGWGGMYGQRDCSSTLMDMYSPFGFWLPRNSYKQSDIGKVLDVSTLDDSTKISFIKDNAIAFKTFLYKEGHIVLYVGTYNDEIVVFQNIWGIRTKNDDVEGRYIVGKTVFTTLKFGEKIKYYDKDAELLKKIKSINIITR